MSVNKKIELVCDICGRKDFKNIVALKVHKNWHDPEYKKNISEKIKLKWHNPGYRSNISKKIKAKWQDPNSKYNSPVGDLPIEESSKKNLGVTKNKPKEVIKFNNYHREYFEKYLKTHDYFDQKSIVKDYIRNKFNGNRIQPNIQVNIEQSFDMLIKNNLEIGKIEYYTPPIYRKKRVR